ncbi:hypothetical protein VKT23_012372 [Stygiomarasmius scandens]|uniref:CCHC-type domain-containing protein n=1 Tax=Marasmiellus scandens TaxID=2682957 RepID=A0ABR1JBB0_9AGAR
MGIPEDKFPKKVALFFKAGSRVDGWYDELEDKVKNGSSDDFTDEFLKEFPSIKVAKPTESERRRELLAMKLQTSELGKRDENTQEWSHQKFARNLLEVAKAAGISKTTSDIIAAYEKLPKMIREKAKEDAKDWTEFVESIQTIEVKWIREKLEDEERIKKLEAKVAATVLETPSKALARGLANTTLDSQYRPQRAQNPKPRSNNEDVFNTNTGGRSNWTAPVGTRRQAASLNDTQKTTLRANIDAYVQKPNTNEGIDTYKRDYANFIAQWGRNPVFNERMIYPYAPGTLKPGSGECFKCGRAWHGRGAECPPGSGSILVNEGHWRAFVQRELGFPRAAQVNVVGEEGDDWMFIGFEAGNGSGSTA